MRTPTSTDLRHVLERSRRLIGRAARRIRRGIAARAHRQRAPRHLRAAFATPGSIDVEEALLLHRLAADASGQCIVEVGTYRGRSAIALAAGAPPDSPVYSVDPHDSFTGVLSGDFGPADRAGFYWAMLRSGAWRQIRLLNTTSQVLSPGWDRPVALLWIDGDHRYDAVRRDWEAWLPHLTDRARVALDDATDPELGPHRLVEELLATGAWRELDAVGKIRVLERDLG